MPPPLPALVGTSLLSLASVTAQALDRDGARDGALAEAFDFDLGFSEDFRKDAERAGGVKAALAPPEGVKVALATSESMSAPKRKNGLSFMISDIWACAPEGGALAASGAFTSGGPLGFGLDSVGKASEEATAGKASEEAESAAGVESCPGEVKSGKAEAVETRGPFNETSSGSDPKSASISCGAGGEDGAASTFGSTGVVLSFCIFLRPR